MIWNPVQITVRRDPAGDLTSIWNSIEITVLAGRLEDITGVINSIRVAIRRVDHAIDHRELGGRGGPDDPAAVCRHAPTEAVSLKGIDRGEGARGVTTHSIRLMQVQDAGTAVCPPRTGYQDLTTDGDIIAQLPIGDRRHRELLALAEHEPGTIEQVGRTILTIRDRGSDQ